MLLCDRVANMRPGDGTADGPLRTAVPVGRRLIAKVRECPVRYVMSDPVYDNSLYAAVEQADCLLAALQTLRAPHPSMWIEWMEPQRADPSVRARAGVLVETDDLGRSGTLSSIWMDAELGPVRAPAFFAFNFDRQLSDGLEAHDADRTDEHLYRCYNDLFRHTAFIVEPVWLDRLRQSAGSEFRNCLDQFFAANVHDVPFFCAFALLLTQPRVLETRPRDLAKLNKSRSKKGSPPLLDHIELHMHLDRPATYGVASGPGMGRLNARLHWVRGHLVHRGSSVFWRRSHIRGDATQGTVLTKTLHVEGSAPMTRAAE